MTTSIPNPPPLESRLALRQRPTRQVVMYQAWHNLLFLHWRWDAAEIQQTLPPGLYVDTFEGQAYLGLVPFFMQNIRPRFVPAVPGISNFLELNLRTYVYDEHGVAGVWFYSLDANKWLAVKVARRFFLLPYYHAKMEAYQQPNGTVEYLVRRLERPVIESSRFIYQPQGTPQYAEPGSLPFFLLERYILFAHHHVSGNLLTGQVYHTPYPYQPAHVPVWDDRVLQWDGFASPNRPPDHVAYSPGVVVEVYPLQLQRAG